MQDACAPGGVCINKINQGYDCSCFPGFSRIEDRKSGKVICEDIDECSLNPQICQNSLEYCENNIGSFSCLCKLGYAKNSDEGPCIDIDECELQHTCTGMHETCENTEGSFRCICKSGFERLSGVDSSNCADVDECEDRCSNTLEICENVDGSYICACIEGYRRDYDDTYCVLIG